ncbi:hypothetical protein [Confluentibacter flavum]|uniref:Uncharacterized protein n=1 Tax=Confluentibacter flavum TaxID=1909700 RepID=A0A2N3HI79_9FLAO|nr:hypothetical protein [Confluentibacter flavum]PKQ44592.1 hypothetical protein CSW08_12450 [Confluentibacter flavum]
MKSKIKIVLLFLVAVVSITAFNVLKKDSTKYNKIKQIESSQSEDKINQESFSDYLQKVSDDTNKKCPMTVDENTRLDNTLVLSGNTIQYNYTLVNFEKGSVDIDLIEKEFTNIILNDVRTNPGLKIFRDKNITMSYYYKDMNGDFVYNYKVTPDLYK